MITFYRVEHPSGKFLYVGNDTFVKASGLEDHNYDSFHTGIMNDIDKTYYKRQLYDTFKCTLDNPNNKVYDDVHDEFYKIIEPYLRNKSFRCFFNNLESLKKWFSQDNLRAIKKGGYQLIKYSFEVDFDPRKIFICEHQSAIDIEYMQRESTIKELIDWDLIIDKPLSERFCDHIRSMTDEEIYARAQTAPDCGFDVDSFLRNREIIGFN